MLCSDEPNKMKWQTETKRIQSKNSQTQGYLRKNGLGLGRYFLAESHGKLPQFLSSFCQGGSQRMGERPRPWTVNLDLNRNFPNLYSAPFLNTNLSSVLFSATFEMIIYFKQLTGLF